MEASNVLKLVLNEERALCPSIALRVPHCALGFLTLSLSRAGYLCSPLREAKSLSFRDACALQDPKPQYYIVVWPDVAAAPAPVLAAEREGVLRVARTGAKELGFSPDSIIQGKVPPACNVRDAWRCAVEIAVRAHMAAEGWWPLGPNLAVRNTAVCTDAHSSGSSGSGYTITDDTAHDAVSLRFTWTDAQASGGASTSGTNSLLPQPSRQALPAVTKPPAQQRNDDSDDLVSDSSDSLGMMSDEDDDEREDGGLPRAPCAPAPAPASSAPIHTTSTSDKSSSCNTHLQISLASSVVRVLSADASWLSGLFAAKVKLHPSAPVPAAPTTASSLAARESPQVHYFTTANRTLDKEDPAHAMLHMLALPSCTRVLVRGLVACPVAASDERARLSLLGFQPHAAARAASSTQGIESYHIESTPYTHAIVEVPRTGLKQMLRTAETEEAAEDTITLGPQAKAVTVAVPLQLLVRDVLHLRTASRMRQADVHAACVSALKRCQSLQQLSSTAAAGPLVCATLSSAGNDTNSANAYANTLSSQTVPLTLSRATNLVDSSANVPAVRTGALLPAVKSTTFMSAVAYLGLKAKEEGATSADLDEGIIRLAGSASSSAPRLKPWQLLAGKPAPSTVMPSSNSVGASVEEEDASSESDIEVASGQPGKLTPLALMLLGMEPGTANQLVASVRWSTMLAHTCGWLNRPEAAPHPSALSHVGYLGVSLSDAVAAAAFFYNASHVEASGNTPLTEALGFSGGKQPRELDIRVDTAEDKAAAARAAAWRSGGALLDCDISVLATGASAPTASLDETPLLADVESADDDGASQTVSKKLTTSIASTVGPGAVATVGIKRSLPTPSAAASAAKKPKVAKPASGGQEAAGTDEADAAVRVAAVAATNGDVSKLSSAAITIAHLKAYCRQHGLQVSGSKPLLVQRVSGHLSGASSAPPIS